MFSFPILIVFSFIVSVEILGNLTLDSAATSVYCSSSKFPALSSVGNWFSNLMKDSGLKVASENATSVPSFGY